MIVLVRCADVDALAYDIGSRSIATARDEQLEAARVTSHEPTRVSEADKDAGGVATSRSRADAGDLYPGKEGCQFTPVPDKRSLLPNQGVVPHLGRPTIAGDAPSKKPYK